MQRPPSIDQIVADLTRSRPMCRWRIDTDKCEAQPRYHVMLACRNGHHGQGLMCRGHYEQVQRGEGWHHGPDCDSQLFFTLTTPFGEGFRSTGNGPDSESDREEDDPRRDG